MKSAITKVGNDHYWTDQITYVKIPLRNVTRVSCLRLVVLEEWTLFALQRAVPLRRSYSNSTAFYTIQRLITVFPHLHTHNFSFGRGGKGHPVAIYNVD